MRRLLPLFLFALAVPACDTPPTTGLPGDAGQPQFRAVAFRQNFRIPLNLSGLVPCANGGAGEVVDLSGNFHVLLHVTLHDDGRFVFKEHFQPQGISGIGEETGDKYQATGVTQDITVQGRVGVTTTAVNNFRIIGQGPGNNLLVHVTFHVTVNANGTATADVNNVRVGCK
jgi:hypothetical protein